MQLFDTHLHLQDDRIWNDREDIINRAIDAGVTKMVCCGSMESDWDRVVELSVKYKQVIPAFGIHPWYISKCDTKWLSLLEKWLIDVPTAAVGEIGLDHALEIRNDNEQNTAFSEQIRLANSLNRAMSIHCRKAWNDLGIILKRENKGNCAGVIHSYSGSPEFIDELIKLGMYISFSGAVTYEHNKRVRLSVARMPIQKMLIETDSPDILPQFKFGTNEPSFLTDIVMSVAKLRNDNVEHIAEVTYANAMSVFGGTTCL